MISTDFCSLWWHPRSVRHWYHRTAALLCIVVLMTPHTFGDEYALEGDGPKLHYRAEIKYTYKNSKRKELVTNIQGKFGTDLKNVKANVTGKIVHVISRSKTDRTKTDHFGCWKYTMKLPSVKWIALVERGECAFTEKLKRATIEYNASAIVIYDNVTSDDTLIRHEEVGTNAAVIISRKNGLTLANLLDNDVAVEMEILRGQVSGNGTVNNSSVLFVSISFITLVVISVAWLMFYYIRKFRYSHAKERLAKRLARAAKKAIAKIPQRTVNAGDKELEGDFDQCAVCIEPYKDGDVIRLMPCRHVFHKSCVDPWLLDHRTCPMCKLDILQAYGMSACKLDILRAYGIQGSQESMHRDAEGAVGMLESIPSAEGGTRSPSSALVLDDHEASSSLDDDMREDSEVKVVLVPHSCLHYHHSRPHGTRPGDMLDEYEEYLGVGAEAEASTGLLNNSIDGDSRMEGSCGSSGSLNTRAVGSKDQRWSKSHEKALHHKADSNKSALISCEKEKNSEELGISKANRNQDGIIRIAAQIEDNNKPCAGTDKGRDNSEPQLDNTRGSKALALSTALGSDDTCVHHLELESEGPGALGIDPKQSEV
ncbi:RING finger protein [Plakobranchus ocellatus]|uniref:RING finger protein n=1 Tax=Plakobranchus ocellatus TaxID=259542 RepID=A0AAV4CDZ1_9GAST|nr:RING finger protein [Plakobranchus ocellatus]